MVNERQKQILKILGDDDRATVNALSEMVGVSTVTVRQDLRHLEEEGLLRRIHGGAVLRGADDLDNRMGIHYDKKLRIARKLSGRVGPGETVLIESGSVNALLARELVRIEGVTVITTNVFIARQFRKNPRATVILLGGIYQHESETLVGQITKSCIEQVHIDKAFIGIDGFTEDKGFMIRDLLRAEISRFIIGRAEDVFIASDSTKFGRSALTTICQPHEAGHVATNQDLAPEFRQILGDAGVELILA